MIEIKRRLHEGIYRSQGGGEIRTLKTWPTNARNLVAACKELPEIREGGRQAYGNIGAGRVWIEIDGKGLDSFEVDQVNQARETRDQEARNLKLPTATQYAASLLQ